MTTSRLHPAVYRGIRVLDCTQGIAGPTATMHLADLGADVLKVEPPEGDRSAAEPGYQCWNRNKQLTVLDLRNQADVRELRRLAGRADAVVFDWPTARMERLGFDATSLRAGRWDLVHVWMPPHGPAGRWAHLPDVPALLAAVSGVADFHRATEDRPVLPVVPILAYAHGALGAAAASAALLSFRRTGTAQAVVVSGLHAVSAMQAAVTVTAPGISSPGMQKVGMASLANYAPYRCADGQWLFLGALTEAFFIEALDVIGLMDVLVMPDVEGSFANILRPEISAGVLRRMQDRFAERDRSAWLEMLDRAGVPVAPVSTRQEWFDSQTVAANRLRVTNRHSVLGDVTMPGLPVELSLTPGAVRHLPDESHRMTADRYWNDDAAAPAGPYPGTPAGEPELPLTGLNVIDASSFVAGTFAPSILAGYGASVVKVEPPTGDPYRAFSGSFAVINQWKRGACLDLTAPDERESFDGLLAGADVFVENLRRSSRQRLGLDAPSVRMRHPHLVHCSMGAYGDGPLAGKPGFDPLLQARSGLMAAQGGIDGPAMSSMLVHDIAAGSLAAVGILAALYHREVSGVAQHVATSLAHTSVMVQAGELTSFDASPPALVGGRDWPGPAPYRRLYSCRDGWLCLWARTDSEVASVHRVLEMNGSQTDGSQTDGDRLAERLAELTAGEALDRLGSARVPAARVLSRFDVYTDPWLAENRMFHPVPDAAVGAYYGVRSFADWPQCAAAPPSRSFAIGDDTAEVLARTRISRPGQ